MKAKLKPIDEQVVVLFGATSGIGLETAMQMVEKDAQVVIVGRNQEGLNEALEQIRSHAEASRMMRGRRNGGHNPDATDFANVEAGVASAIDQVDQVIALEADITNFDQVKGVAEQVVQRFGRIDTWVNLAAVSEWALFEDTTPDEFRRIIEVNLVGHAYGAMAALPYMKQQDGGALIFVSSMAGRIPIPYQSAYNASKHGLLGLVETLRLELKHTNVPVSVTAILPASMNTPLFEKARTKLGVEPDPVPPVYEAKMAGRAIVYAAQHPVRELIVGDAGYAINFMRRLAPTLTNNYMGATGFRQQRSNDPKSAQAPDNLYEHVSGYEQVEGDNPPRAGRVSVLTWFSTHPRARTAIMAGIMATIGGLVGWQVMKARNERMHSWRYQIPHRTKRFMKQARKMSKHASKSMREAGFAAASLPVIHNLPMFHRKTFFERVSDKASDRLGDWWAAFQGLLLALPFLRRKSMSRRMAEKFADRRKMMTRQGQHAVEFVSDTRKKTAEFVTDQRKAATEFVSDRSKAVTGFVSDKLPTRKEIRKELKKAASKLPERTHTVERKRVFIEKWPFGEYRKTTIEKVPVEKK